MLKMQDAEHFAGELAALVVKIESLADAVERGETPAGAGDAMCRIASAMMDMSARVTAAQDRVVRFANTPRN